MGTRIADLKQMDIDLIEVEPELEVDLIEVDGAGFGSSMFHLHANFLIISGGTPKDDMSNRAQFVGGNPSSVFSVSSNFINRI